MAATSRYESRERPEGLVARLKLKITRPVDRARRRRPLLDRALTTASCYKQGGGDREAAALSYYGFLAVFPAILVAISVLGFVLRDAETVRQTISEGVQRVLPGAASLLEQSLRTIQRRAGTIGAIGIVGLVWSGLGAIDVLRGALDRMFGVKEVGGVKGKLRDLKFAVVAGLLLLASISFGGLAAGGVHALLDNIGLGELKPVGILMTLVLTFLTDLALFVLLFATLPNHGYGWRRVLQGAVVAAIGWTLMKSVGGWYVGRTAARSQASYGVAAAAFGLLITINLASRLTLFSAEWAAQSAGCGSDKERRPATRARRPRAEFGGIEDNTAAERIERTLEERARRKRKLKDSRKRRDENAAPGRTWIGLALVFLADRVYRRDRGSA
ncbi:MAG TPA: YihY/virulence factor BrkB family protein [Actinomycetota bacterium]|nr:YihY/virulence factor BrkB family protein [Actinomycetota bacterium]